MELLSPDTSWRGRVAPWVMVLGYAGFVTALDERVYGMETVVARKPRT